MLTLMTPGPGTSLSDTQEVCFFLSLLVNILGLIFHSMIPKGDKKISYFYEYQRSFGTDWALDQIVEYFREDLFNFILSSNSLICSEFKKNISSFFFGGREVHSYNASLQKVLSFK